MICGDIAWLARGISDSCCMCCFFAMQLNAGQVPGLQGDA